MSLSWSIPLRYFIATLRFAFDVVVMVIVKHTLVVPMIYSRRQVCWLEFLSRLPFELVYRFGKTSLADPYPRKASCADVSTILLAQEGRSSKMGTSSDL